MKAFLNPIHAIALLSILLSFGISSNCKAQYPTDSFQVTLLTISPGTEIYSFYGHDALRVYDPSKGIDIIYNYGVFDFDTPNFYLKFIGGRLLYKLAKSTFDDFLYEYKQTGQAVFQQVLNLNNHEKYQLLNNLEISYLPENRYYRYDFFHDNCATRIRNVIAKSIDGKIVYDSSYIKKPESFRDMIKFYQHWDPWVDLGTHLLIGSNADSIMTIKDYMFSPGCMMDIYTHSYITNGNTKPLVLPATTILQGKIIREAPNPITSPMFAFGTMFLVVLMFSFGGYRKRHHYKVIDHIILLLTGLLGLTILLVWVGSSHEVLSRNYNIVWANPINLVIMVFLFFKTPPKWFSKALIIYSLLLILFMGISIFIPQSLPGSSYFITGIIVVRLVKNGLYLR